MNLKNFDELLELLKNKAEIQNASYKEHYESLNLETTKDPYLSDKSKEHLIQPINDSPQYLDVMDFVNRDFAIIEDTFKDDLIKMLNYHFIDICNEHWLKDFYFLKLIIKTYKEIEFQYYNVKFPYGFKDLDKYDKRIHTLVKKKVAFVIPQLPAYENIKFCLLHGIELLKNCELDLLPNRQRDREAYIKDVVINFLDLIIKDNYGKINEKKKNKRITDKQRAIYKNVLETFRNTVLTSNKNL